MSVWGVLRTLLLIVAAFVALAVGWVLVVGLQKPPADPTLGLWRLPMGFLM